MKLALDTSSWQVQVGALAALAVVGLGIFETYWAGPRAEDLASKRTQLASVRADITKAAATARQLDEFRASVDALERQLAELRDELPEEKEAADLIRRMQSVAAESHLTITRFAPAAIVTRDVHAEWPIALELDGTYDELVTFFDRMNKLTRIVTISDLHIKSKEKPQAGSTVEAQCVATTFVLLRKPAKKKGAKPVSPKSSDAKPETVVRPAN